MKRGIALAALILVGALSLGVTAFQPPSGPKVIDVDKIKTLSDTPVTMLITTHTRGSCQRPRGMSGDHQRPQPDHDDAGGLAHVLQTSARIF